MIIEEIRTAVAAKSSALVRRSADDLAVLIHPDFLYVTAGGKTLTKADYVDVAVNGRFVYHGQQVRELEVRLFGTTAVASMLIDDHSWTDGRWLWAAGQTMLPKHP